MPRCVCGALETVASADGFAWPALSCVCKAELLTPPPLLEWPLKNGFPFMSHPSSTAPVPAAATLAGPCFNFFFFLPVKWSTLSQEVQAVGCRLRAVVLAECTSTPGTS